MPLCAEMSVAPCEACVSIIFASQTLQNFKTSWNKSPEDIRFPMHVLLLLRFQRGRACQTPKDRRHQSVRMETRKVDIHFYCVKLFIQGAPLRRHEQSRSACGDPLTTQVDAFGLLALLQWVQKNSQFKQLFLAHRLRNRFLQAWAVLLVRANTSQLAPGFPSSHPRKKAACPARHETQTHDSVAIMCSRLCARRLLPGKRFLVLLRRNVSSRGS